MIRIKSFLISIIAAFSLFVSCNHEKAEDYDVQSRDAMRSFIENISDYAKSSMPAFLIIPQNGQELFKVQSTGDVASEYLQSIDGTAREDLNYGYPGMNDVTPAEERNTYIDLLRIAKARKKLPFTIDYCNKSELIDSSYQRNKKLGFLDFCATSRELDNIPSYYLYDENDLNIDNINQVKNFLYIINPGKYSSKNDYLNALKQTDYDMLIIDAFYNDTPLTKQEVLSLKIKDNGHRRIVIAYMNIGEAENYRYYWQSSWDKNAPEWLVGENKNWQGNYKVKYWDEEWQNLIYGNSNAYLDKIMNAGFDGTFLDMVDAFQYFEK